MKKLFLTTSIVWAVSVTVLLGFLLLKNKEKLLGVTVLFPQQGGTGTSSIPVANRVLLSNASGTYSIVPTSSLLIAGSSVQGFTTSSINGAVSTTFTFATTSDTNIGLAITTSTDAIIFNPFWIGTLADARITSAATWNAKLGPTYPAEATSTFVLKTATTSFPNLAVVGTITTGVWQGTLIDILRGGTNSSTVGSNGCVKYSDGTRMNCTDVGTLGFILQSIGAGRPIWINSTTLNYLGLGYPATVTSTFMQISASTTYNFQSPSITIASTSLQIGVTTTIPIGFAIQAETWNSYGCYTDTATATVQFGTLGGAYMIAVFASSTGTIIPQVSMSANNTFATGVKRAVQIGNIVNMPNYITCTIKKQF